MTEFPKPGEYQNFNSTLSALEHVFNSKIAIIKQLKEIGKDDTYIQKQVNEFIKGLEYYLDQARSGNLAEESPISLDILADLLNRARALNISDKNQLDAFVSHCQALLGVVPGLQRRASETNYKF